MPRHATTVEARRSYRRRSRDAAMEAGVLLSLALAILAVICTLGIDRAAAAGLDGLAASDGGRFTVGAVLIAVFAGLCVLTTFMLRNTLRPAPQLRRIRRERQG